MSTQNIYALTDTWNAGGTTFTAIKMDVLDTASAAGSALIDLQVGGTSQFRVSKGGAVSVGSTIELGHASDTTLARGSAGVVTVEGNTVYTSSNLPGTAITWTAVQNISAAATATASVLTLNATDSFGYKIRLQDNGNLRGYLGANNTYILTVGDAGGVDRLDLTGGASPVLRVNTNTVYHAGNLPGTAITWTANQTLSNVDLVLGTSAGTKIGTATNQKLGFFNATPVVQPTAVADATDAASVITQLNALLSRMRSLGLIAT